MVVSRLRGRRGVQGSVAIIHQQLAKAVHLCNDIV
jgi:hypothetical protein